MKEINGQIDTYNLTYYREPSEVESMEDTAQSGSPEKDAIAQTMEEEETKQEEPVQS